MIRHGGPATAVHDVAQDASEAAATIAEASDTGIEGACAIRMLRRGPIAATTADEDALEHTQQLLHHILHPRLVEVEILGPVVVRPAFKMVHIAKETVEGVALPSPEAEVTRLSG